MKKIFANFLIISSLTFTFHFEANAQKNGNDTLTILQSNDTHSRIDAIAKNDKRNPNAAGYALRSSIINRIRKSSTNFLLFDSGDFLQGTPYFNYFNGMLEIELMNLLGYHAVTLGNHEFDNGVERLAEILKTAKFKIINSNYDVSKTKLKSFVIPYYIFKFTNFKVGVIGLGVNPEGLISTKNFTGITYNEPIQFANKYADFLKKRKHCDIVICLSHLGFKQDDNKPSDVKLASESENIDIILGGHTHTILEEAFFVNNLNNRKIIIAQNGSMGIRLSLIKSIIQSN